MLRKITFDPDDPQPAPVADHDTPAGSDGFRPPATFDDFRIVRPLGRGGMGVVYLAEDTLLERQVAIKFLLQAPGAEALARVHQEARALARLSHPHVVTLYRVGALAGRPYLVTEYVPGTTLDQLPSPVPPARLLPLAEAVAGALCALHRSGVLHRDLKPANIIVTPTGSIKLIDFGLALMAGSAGLHAGTPRYMAPELHLGELPSPASDLYALGVILHELQSGVTPAQESTAPPPGPAPPPLVSEPESALAALIARCLRPRPEERPESAEALHQALLLLTEPAPEGAAGPDNPYRGLSPFEAAHSALFFGREVEAREILERLRGAPILVITGPSGAGKSSLCLCGVLPLLRASGLGDERRYHAVVVRPGPRPYQTLRAALAPWLDAADAAEDSRALQRRLGRAGLLIYVDQAEELVTQGAAEAAAFLDALRALTAAPGCRVLLSLREDFLTRLLLLCREAVGIYALGPLTDEGLRRAITEPARRCGAPFASADTVAALLCETRATDGGLPLLQFTLAALWEARDPRLRVIPARALDDLGGLSGALARHADQSLRGLRPDERLAARQALRLLVSPEGTRLRRRESELPGGAVLEALVQARVLVASAEEGEPTYELAHEALLRGWPQLHAWREEDAHAALRGRLRRRALLGGVSVAALVLVCGGAALVGLRVRQDLAYRRLLVRLQREEAGLRAQELARQPGREVEALVAALRGVAPDPSTAPQQAVRGLFAAVQRGRRSLPLRAHAAEINQLLFAPDGAGLLSLGKDHRVVLWGLDGRRRCEIQRPTGEAITGVFAPLPGGAQPSGAAATRAYVAWEDNTVKILDLSGCRITGELRGHRENFQTIGVYGQGTRLWTTDLRTEARLWALPEGAPLAVLPDEGPAGVATPDGSALALGSQAGRVRLRAARTGQVVRELLGHSQVVRALAFTPDGSRLASSSADGTIRLWDAQSGAPLAVISGEGGWLSFSADGGSLLGVGRDGVTRLWETRSGRLLRALEGRSPQVAAHPLSEGRILTTAQDGSGTIYDQETGQVLAVLRGHRGAAATIAVSPDGAHIATGGNDAVARLWSGASGTVTPVLRGHGNAVWDVRFSADGRRLATCSRDRTARLWDGLSGRPLLRLPEQAGAVGAVVFLPGGDLLTRTGDGALQRWDQRGALVAVLIPGGPAQKNLVYFALSPDGTQVLAGEPEGTARIRGVDRGEVRVVLAGHRGPIRGVSFSPDGERALVVTQEGHVRLWRRDGTLIADLVGHRKAIGRASFSADGARIVTASDDHTARLWDGHSGAPLLVLPHADEVWGAAFSPDGARVVTGGIEQDAHLWSTSDGRLLHTLRGHLAKVQGVAWSPDGRLIATASFDQTLRLWDGRDGAPRAVLRGHTAWIRSMAFSPDGTRLASVSMDGTARLWDVQRGRLWAAKESEALLLPIAGPNDDHDDDHDDGDKPAALRSGQVDPPALPALVARACQLVRPQPDFAQVVGAGINLCR